MIEGPKPGDSRTFTSQLEQRQTQWLQESLAPFSTVDPEVPLRDFESDPLKSLVEGARIIALGEVTHGSREVFQMKDRLIRHLVEQEGVRHFAMEASMAAAEGVNEYILSGKGDATQAIFAMGYWVWSTEEVRSMVEWMRDFNVKNPNDPVQFFGFDMMDIRTPCQKLHELVAECPGLDPNIQKEIMDGCGIHSEARNLALARSRLVQELRTERRENEVVELQSSLDKLLEKWDEALIKIENGFRAELALSSQKRAARYLSLIRQFVEEYKQDMVLDGGVHRDKCMAENVASLLTDIGEAKLIIWAHNWHILRSSPFQALTPSGGRETMGCHLANSFGAEYVAIGFALGGGECSGVKEEENTVSSGRLADPPRNSFEHALLNYCQGAKMEGPALVPFPENLEDFPWSGEIQMNRTGALIVEDPARAFGPSHPSKEFNALIYIPKSTPSKVLQEYFRK